MPIDGTKTSWDKYLPGERQLFSAPGYLMQNPEEGWTLEALEGKRKDMELFRWLRKQGVYGRWIKVYRPTLEHGDKTFILQRMTWDNMIGLIMISNRENNPIIGKSAVIYPKGLLPDKEYTIEALEGGMEKATKTGAEWMKEGIRLSCVNYGEGLLINLPGRPGQGTDTQPPTAPGFAVKKTAIWFGYEGIELNWGESDDNVMVSYYEIYKNGQFLNKVSIGTYYFDEQGSIADKYEIRSVDADGNTSDFVVAS